MKKSLFALLPAFAFIALAAVGTRFAAPAIAQNDDAPAVKVDQPAPDFTLTDLNGDEHTLSDYTADGKIVVLEWFSPECPFVVKHYADEDNRTINKIVADYADDNVVVLAINSAAPSHPYANRAKNQAAVEGWEMSHDILMDPTGEVGKAYGAKRTPEMYVIDAEGVLRYMGALDNDRDTRGTGDINYVRQALDEIIAGETVSTKSTDAYGCTVKYAK